MGVWIVYTYKGKQFLGVAIEQAFSTEAKALEWIASYPHPSFRYVTQYYPVF